MRAPASAPAVTAASAAPTPLLLSLHEASVRFGAVRALEGVSLSLHRGERVALVGANGGGKTTLLRLLHGLVPCDAGWRAAHAPAAGVPGPRMAMLFQRPFLLNLSVRTNLALALWLHGLPRGQRASRCRLALERVGLEALADRSARSLSGGQQQRLALARAWAVRPDILLLDEPTASLDPSAKREVEALIEEFARDGLTVVMSTHNLGQARRLAGRVIHLEAGRVVVDLPTDRFFNDPLPPAAAQFLAGELPWT